jgi:hypothetical protein
MNICLKCKKSASLCKCRKMQRPKQLKYRNEETKGFASKKEEGRHKELLLREHAGLISRLEIQPVFILMEGFRDLRAGITKDGKAKAVAPIKYIADFKYLEHGITWVVEDVKSPATRKNSLYRVKIRLFLANEKFKKLDFREI